MCRERRSAVIPSAARDLQLSLLLARKVASRAVSSNNSSTADGEKHPWAARRFASKRLSSPRRPSFARDNLFPGADMSADCLFCRIVRREIPATIVAEDDHCLAFNDIGPKAPTHVLVIPKAHFATLNDVKDSQVTGRLFAMVQQIARDKGFDTKG